MTTLQDKAKAMTAGRDACNEGQPFLSNPYDRYTRLWKYWRMGYLAQLDDNRGALWDIPIVRKDNSGLT